jgi:2-desacetyl-2-hydroxyethyl bacteriochlorophyllide A dehydrogenase
MKAARVYGPRDLRVEEFPVRPLEPAECLCRVLRCGVCGTDVAIYSGEASFVKKGLVDFPMTPGHEWSGLVEQIGPAVDRFRPGDRVLGDGAVSCGSCPSCLRGEYFACRRLRAVGTLNTWDGAYAEFIIMPQRHLFAIPENVDLENAAMVEPAANAYNGVRQSGLRPGDSVLIHGTGPIGLMAVSLARLAGAARVLVTGRKPWKLEIARQLGAEVTINVDAGAGSLGRAVRESCGSGGVDCVIEAAGAAELLRESVEHVRPNGVIALIGFYERPMNGFDIDGLIYGGVRLHPVSGGLHAMEPVLRLMSSGRLDVRRLITHRRPLAEAAEAIQDVLQRRPGLVKMMLEMGPLP